MPVPHLPSALARLQIALADLPSGPVRADLEHALAIATFDADGAGDGGPLHAAALRPGAAGPRGPDVPGPAAPSPLTEAMDELQRALIWEADNAEFLDANLNSSVYLRAAGHLDRAAAALSLSADAPAPR